MNRLRPVTFLPASKPRVPAGDRIGRVSSWPTLSSPHEKQPPTPPAAYHKTSRL